MESRRKNHRLVFGKMNTGIAPDYLSNLLPTASQYRYALRNSENTPLIPCKTKLYSDSFIPATIRQWNTLPQSARNALSLQVFKTKLQTQKHKSTINYNSGARINQILHCRLRLGCSSLKHDLYRKNIINSPLCTSGQVETQTHYLLHCTKTSVLQKLAMPNNCQQFTIWRRQITSRHKCPNCHELT